MAKSENSIVIDATRGVAALMVLFSHSDAYNLLPLITDGAVRGMLGEIGVNLFFVLSGFLIWKSSLNTMPDVRTYAIHRVTRVLPLYLFALLAVIVLTSDFRGGFKPEYSLSSLLRHLTFTQSLSPPVSRDFNPVLWTLTHEFLYYMLVPLLWYVKRVFVFVVAALMGLSLAANHGLNIPIFNPFFEVLYMFLVGALAAHYRLKFNWIVVLSSLVLLLLAQRHFPQGSNFAWALVIFCSALAIPKNASVAVVPLAWVGIISYSLYISHYIVIEIYGSNTAFTLKYVDRAYLQDLFVVLCFLIPILTYLLIEKPSMTIVRRLLLKKARASGVTKASTEPS